MTSDDAARWWATSARGTLDAFGVDEAKGLCAAAASESLRIHGANRLESTPPRSAPALFFAQFRSPLVAVLAAAAILSAAVGDLKDAGVILVVVVLNALVGFWQEYRAERSLDALRLMLPARARVRRDGRVSVIAAEAIVAGDIVLLEAGDRVPADGRLVAAASLAIDESALTGESQSAEKDSLAVLAPECPLGDRVNMACMNTMVVRGRAELLVTATGMSTQMGAISAQLATAPDAPSPLQIQLDRFGKRLGAVVIAMIALLFAYQLAQGTEMSHAIMDAIALAVAGVPEGLPVVVTVTLALGMRRMARQRAIVKRLPSVETLGCTTVICSDKTGTLTLNQMTARRFSFGERVFLVGGEGYSATGEIAAEDGLAVPPLDPVMLAIVACNDSELHAGKVAGDPMEGALLALAAKAGFDAAAVRRQLPRSAEIPFDSAHKFMATVHRDESGWVLWVKGAPDVLLPLCTQARDEAGLAAIDETHRARIASGYERLASGGLRGLLVAERRLEAQPQAQQLQGLVSELTFLSLIGIVDPPRPEAKQAIERCRGAGIAVKMITGDHGVTAQAIARELGLEGGVITGKEVDRLDDKALSAGIDAIAVFARVTAQHKVRIVEALRSRGHVVAMTGDGVNDAPALKRADIGIAMGINGTEVSKEAASMVLTDDNFATIVDAVREGRALYDNIIKFIRFQLATTVGALATVFAAPLLGMPEPFTAIQILWVALIMDGPPAVSLALDGPRPGLMHEPPRSRQEPILPWRRMAVLMAIGAIMAAGTLGILAWGLAQGYGETRATTLALTTFVLFQVFNAFNSRTERTSVFNRSLFTNGMLWSALLGVVALHVLAVHWPAAQPIFRTEDLSARDWGLAVLAAFGIVALEEGRKSIARALATRSPR